MKHILFDNDGTIVDSEHLAVGSMLELLRPHGIEISRDEYNRKFPGLISAQILEIIRREHGIHIEPEIFLQNLRQHHNNIFDRELQAVAGMSQIFKNLKVPKSMVSNGSVAHVERCLRRVGLLDWLDGQIFSGYDVGSPKPAPDVYLVALKKLGLAPDEVVVVEDSPVGVQSGKAAGLQVIGFLGASHADDGLATRLLDCGADILAADADELQQIFEKFGVI